MSNNDFMELKKEHSSHQNKYSYLLLAISASAIAFAIEKTSGQKIAYSQILLLISVFLWGLSFYFGCKNLHYIQILIQSNYQLLLFQNNIHPLQTLKPEVCEKLYNETDKSIIINSKKAEFYNNWQFRLIIIGAIFFILWHVLEMVLKSC